MAEHLIQWADGQHYTDNIFKCIFLKGKKSYFDQHFHQSCSQGSLCRWHFKHIFFKGIFLIWSIFHRSLLLFSRVSNWQQGPLLPKGFNCVTLIPAWISSYVSSKVWDEITYPFPNFNSCTIEVWEWICNFISHFTGHVITYPCWD